MRFNGGLISFGLPTRNFFGSARGADTVVKALAGRGIERNSRHSSLAS